MRSDAKEQLIRNMEAIDPARAKAMRDREDELQVITAREFRRIQIKVAEAGQGRTSKRATKRRRPKSLKAISTDEFMEMMGL